MATERHAAKRSAQNLNNSNISMPNKAVKTKIQKLKNEKNDVEESNNEKEIELKDIYEMMQSMMTRLNKLDSIESRVMTFEEELRDMRASIEYAHGDIKELKDESEARKKSENLAKQKLEKLEKENELLSKSIVDLKARSMRDNLIFYNLPETKEENTTDIIHNLLEEKLGVENVRRDIKIDRSHRLGKPRSGESKPQPIVARFNYFQDREQILKNAKKLKGSNLGIGEQFPEEIVKIRKELYPELKRAKDA
ncbi:unc-13-like C, partial [Paramuricea clavata]